MDPGSYLALRKLKEIEAEDRRSKLTRRNDADCVATDMTVERALQGRLAAACSRLRATWISRSSGPPRPMEPTSV